MEISVKIAEKITGIIVTAYLIIMFVVYPLYMKDGYVNISGSKFFFFISVSGVGIVLMLILSVMSFLSWKKLGIADIFVLVFAVVTTISFLFSPYKKVSFCGAEGWYVGFVTMLTCCLLYYFISRLWKVNIKIIYAALFASGIVYILGILDRFSLYVIPIEIRDPSFISTIGNINWFMGYFSVLTPIGVGLFLAESSKGSKIKKLENVRKNDSAQIMSIREILLGVYVFLSFAVGLAQGSESVILFLGALFLGLTVLAQFEVFKIKDIFLVLAMGSLGGYLIYVLRILLGNGYNYESDGICAVLTNSPILLLVFALSLVVWYVCSLTNFKESKVSKRFEKIFFGIVYTIYALAVIFWLVIGFFKQKYGYFENLTNSVFLFNEHFGSGRGAAYQIAVEALKSMSWKERIFGVGPDAFSEFIYNNPSTLKMVMSYWPGDYLTNSHCEILTMLINEGILGVISFIGIFVAYISSALKDRKKCDEKVREDADRICRGEYEQCRCKRREYEQCEYQQRKVLYVLASLSIFCYMIHNLISFTQVLSTPLLFLIMGMGRAVFFDNEKL